MRLIIVTQTVDSNDRNLGFFASWIEAFAKHTDVVVIANEVGAYQLPENVEVISLGKEKGASRFARIRRYRKLLRELLPQSDGVFFHMCPEYVLAAYPLVQKFRKKSALWYVHKQVSLKLRLAEKLVDRIFTASTESFRLPSKKVEIVGHGIDTEIFKPQTEHTSPLHLVTVGRIAPVKDVRTIILGFIELQKEFPQSRLSVIGEAATANDRKYEKEVRALSPAGISFESAAFGTVFSRSYSAFVHASQTGSMDKAVLEALAVGLPVFTSSEAF
ncbi:MAG: glycosyltransferase, partial [bacterium]|nr:glycosyltransferase [bacterium]